MKYANGLKSNNAMHKDSKSLGSMDKHMRIIINYSNLED